MAKTKAKAAAGAAPAAVPETTQGTPAIETPETGIEEKTDHGLIAAMEAEVDRLKSELDEANGLIAEQSELLSRLQADNAEASKELTVEVDGELYEVLSGAYPHTSADLAADPELCKPFLEIEGQNVLRKKF